MEFECVSFYRWKDYQKILLLRSLLSLQRRCKRHTSAQKNIKSKFLQRSRKNLPCLYVRDFGTASAIKKINTKYQKYFFIRTAVNPWKKKCNDGDWTVTKSIGRPNLLDSCMLKKVKDIALGTRMAGGVINRRQLISIATGVGRANNPNLLK